MARSRQRRRLTEITRAARRRQKRISLALSAALAAGPVVPEAVTAAESTSGPNTAGNAATNGNDLLGGQRVVLREGTSGRLVTAAQMRLNQVLPVTHLSVDGVFGPLTRGAVLEFQRRQHLNPTGSIDARTWAILFKAPVLVMDGTSASGSAGASSASGVAMAAAGGHSGHVGSRSLHRMSVGTGGGSGSNAAAHPRSMSVAGRGRATSASSRGGTTQRVAAIAPSAAPPQTSTYVMTNGVALPLPRGYLTNGSVDQGVDYAAPGGTPLYAMGDGVIIGAGISGFGPNAPILKITSGPLAGSEIYYGHAGANSVSVGQHVHAGQQISQVGYGIVGISTGPHLEIGFYPPGGMGAGGKMLSVINGALSQRGIRARTAGPGAVSMGGPSLCHRRGSSTRSSAHARRHCDDYSATSVHASRDTDDYSTAPVRVSRDSDDYAPAATSTHASYRVHRSTRRPSSHRVQAVRPARVKTTHRLTRPHRDPRSVRGHRLIRRPVSSGVRKTSTRRPRR